jgi:hypothetical protein
MVWVLEGCGSSKPDPRERRTQRAAWTARGVADEFCGGEPIMDRLDEIRNDYVRGCGLESSAAAAVARPGLRWWASYRSCSLMAVANFDRIEWPPPAIRCNLADNVGPALLFTIENVQALYACNGCLETACIYGSGSAILPGRPVRFPECLPLLTESGFLRSVRPVRWPPGRSVFGDLDRSPGSSCYFADFNSSPSSRIIM